MLNIIFLTVHDQFGGKGYLSQKYLTVVNRDTKIKKETKSQDQLYKGYGTVINMRPVYNDRDVDKKTK